MVPGAGNLQTRVKGCCDETLANNLFVHQVFPSVAKLHPVQTKTMNCFVGWYLIVPLIISSFLISRTKGFTARLFNHRSTTNQILFRSSTFDDDSMSILQSTTDLASLSFGEDPIISEKRRRAFEKLKLAVMSLAEYEGLEAVQLVPSEDEKAQEYEAVTKINSLLFQVENKNETVLVILNSKKKVDMTKLKEVLDASWCSLADEALVEPLCGFPPGSVPPIAHSPNVLRTIVDIDLMQDGAVLLGGGGHPDMACRIRVDMLLALEGVHLADISFDDEGASSKSFKTRKPFYKPFFPYPPPPITTAQACYSQGFPNPLQPIPVTLVGRISGVRRMSQRLCFIDFAPPNYSGSGNSMLDQYDLPWRSAIDGNDMAVQLIAGKTMCQTMGDEEGSTAMKRFKPGQLLIVEGMTNVGNRDSLGNWMNKRSFDVVLINFTILDEVGFRPEKSQPIPIIKLERTKHALSSTELRRMHISAEIPSTLPVGSAQDFLKLSDIFPKEDAIVLVDSIETVSDFTAGLEEILQSLPLEPINGDDENSVPGLKNVAMVGIDCEWKPSFMASPSEPHPVLLLQISIQPLQKVFLLDLQNLLRPLLAPLEEMNLLEIAVSDSLTKLFLSKQLLKIGFQLKADLRLLAGSYPHVSSFRVFHSVLDVSLLARKSMQLAKIRNSRQLAGSLASLTEFLVKKPISKEQQVSDWSMRPLTNAQLEYSSLDAAISPHLFEKAMKLADVSWFPHKFQIGRWADDSAFSKSVVSLRFMFLDSNDPMVIRKLKAKRIVGDPYVVTQSWATGMDGPELPSVPSDEGHGPYRDVQGILRVPVGLISIGGNKTHLDSIVGLRLRKSKDKCLEMVVKDNKNVPDGAMLEFHQRAGYVEFRDGVVLFVNMPTKSSNGRARGYPNEWIDNGKSMTWFMRDHEWNRGTSELATKLQGGINNDVLVLLFVRMGKGDFLCCGPCKISVSEVIGDESDVKDWSLVQLNLELLAFEKLKGLQDFTSMVLADEIDSNSEEGESRDEGTIDEMTNEKSKMEIAQALLRLVDDGDLISAMYLASKNQRDKSRSIRSGLDTLRSTLVQSTLDVSNAVKIIDSTAGQMYKE